MSSREEIAEKEGQMRSQLADMAGGTGPHSAAVKWALDRLARLETVADALLEHENALGEIPCPGRRGTTMRCMPGDKCSFCRSRDLVKRCASVMDEPTAG